MKLNQLLILGLGAMMIMACRREGCTDQTANNYDKKAKKDNGTCQYGNDPSNPGGGGGTNNPGGETLPIRLTGTENDIITIVDKSSNPNVADYYLDGDWNINADVKINPGVRIEMRPGARIYVNPNGSLDATGTVSNKIELFGAQNVSGYWRNISYNSNNPNNKLIYCNISNGSDNGSSDPATIVVSDNNQVTIKNTTISKGSGFGVMTKGENAKLPGFESNYINSFTKAPIRLGSWSHTNYLDNSTIVSDNEIPYIYIYGASVKVNTFVPKMNVAYSIRDNVVIYDSHLKVEAGVETRMAANTQIYVTANASIEFDGTASNRCSFIGDLDTQTKGFWHNIFIQSNNPNNRFSHTDIIGGRTFHSYDPGFVRLDGNASLAMDNCHISLSPSIAVGGTASTANNPGATLNNNGGNTWSDCDGGGGLLP